MLLIVDEVISGMGRAGNSIRLEVRRYCPRYPDHWRSPLVVGTSPFAGVLANHRAVKALEKAPRMLL